MKAKLKPFLARASNGTTRLVVAQTEKQVLDFVSKPQWRIEPMSAIAVGEAIASGKTTLEYAAPEFRPRPFADEVKELADTIAGQINSMDATSPAAEPAAAMVECRSEE